MTKRQITGHSLIAGAWVPGSGRAIVASGFDGQGRITLPGEFLPTKRDQVQGAFDAATRAHLTAPSRELLAKFLDKVADNLEANADAIIARAHQETKLPVDPRLAKIEMPRTVGQLRLHAKLLRNGWYLDCRINTAVPDNPGAPDYRSMAFGIGPVVIFGACNFPLAFSIVGGDFCDAISAGCPVIAKAHPLHPGTCELIAEQVRAAAAEVGLDPGFFSMVHGGPKVGKMLVQHKDAAAVAFTGSFATAEKIRLAMQKREVQIPFYAECGAVNPVIIFPEAMSQRLEALATGFVGNMSMGVGQFCTNPGLLLGDSSSPVEDFIRLSATKLAALPPGTMLSQGTCGLYQEAAEAMLRLDPVTLVEGSTTTGADPNLDQATAMLARMEIGAILEDPRRILTTEVFGPFSIVGRGTMEQIAALLAQPFGQLTVSFHATDGDIDRYAKMIGGFRHRAGRIIQNGWPAGHRVCDATVHDGPWPACFSRGTSFGTRGVSRFQAHTSFQGHSQRLLPVELRNESPGFWRLIDGEWTQAAVAA